MTGARYPTTIETHGPIRSLEQALADLVERLRSAPLTAPDRNDLIRMILNLEAAIDERGSL